VAKFSFKNWFSDLLTCPSQITLSFITRNVVFVVNLYGIDFSGNNLMGLFHRYIHTVEVPCDGFGAEKQPTFICLSGHIALSQSLFHEYCMKNDFYIFCMSLCQCLSEL